MSDYRKISWNGLWHNNPGLVQLLGLCPLLAVTNSVVNALGLGFATIATLVISNASVSVSRRWIRPEIRIPFYVLVIATNVTLIELLMSAWFYDLYLILGIFIPLIVTNCVIIARAEAFASKNTLLPAALDGFMMGLGFTLVLLALGAMRELLGSGTLFANAHLMFGEQASVLTLNLSENYRGFLLAILPPGAFFGMGLLIAFKNSVDRRLARKKKHLALPVG